MLLGGQDRVRRGLYAVVNKHFSLTSKPKRNITENAYLARVLSSGECLCRFVPNALNINNFLNKHFRLHFRLMATAA